MVFGNNLLVGHGTLRKRVAWEILILRHMSRLVEGEQVIARREQRLEQEGRAVHGVVQRVLLLNALETGLPKVAIVSVSRLADLS